MNELGLVPIGDRIIVERDRAVERTEGGIELPKAAQEKPCEGTVRAIGPGRMLQDGTRAPLSLTVGARVIFSAYAGVPIPAETARDLVVMREEDVLCARSA